MESLIRRLIRGRPAVIALACASALTLMGVPASSAQDRPVRRPPGWLVKSSVAVNGTWDDNVSLAGQGDLGGQDYVTLVNPRLGLDFRGRRSTFGLDYGAGYSFYRRFDQLNRLTQHASLDYSRRFSSRFAMFADNTVSLTPSTDDLELDGIPFRRLGTRMDLFHTGMTVTPTRRTSITSSYMFQWIDFEQEERLAPLFRGGHVHGGAVDVRHRLSRRLSVGGQYDIRRAIVGEALHEFDIQSVAGSAGVALTRQIDVGGAFGYSRLQTDTVGIGAATRTAPTFRMSFSQSTSRVSWDVSYSRSYLPSLGFGGTFQNRQWRTSALVPIFRRLDWTGSVTVRENEPLTPTHPSLKAVWTNSTLVLRARRWMRLEAFYTRIYQDSRRAGGQIDRTQMGIQVVTTNKSLRIH